MPWQGVWRMGVADSAGGLGSGFAPILVRLRAALRHRFAALGHAWTGLG
jgi:hypothetical protein